MGYLGSLSSLQHEVRGEVYSVAGKQLLIRGFNYDGTAPDAFFLADTRTPRPNSEGRIVLPYPADGRSYQYDDTDIPILDRRFSNEDIVLELPAGVHVDDLTWISVWCRQFSIDFGNLILRK